MERRARRLSRPISAPALTARGGCETLGAVLARIPRHGPLAEVNWCPDLVPARLDEMRTLPDYLRKGMKLVIVGCNPSESSVRVGHYYAGRVNQFWPVLYKGGVVPEPFDYHDDKRVIEFGIGLTDLVKRPTKTTAELTREDFAEGRIVLSQRLGEFTRM